MDIVTIACPPNFNDPNIANNAATWYDVNGTEYKVTSGLVEGYVTSDPIGVRTNRVNVIVGMNGLEALGTMGLTLLNFKGDING